MNEYRFRANWLGKLILQRRYKVWDGYDRVGVWQDATVEGLQDYYRQFYKQTKEL
jgi:hypothetical protein